MLGRKSAWGERGCDCCYFGHSKRSWKRREAAREIREQSVDLYNGLTDCPVCGENVYALDGNDHSDC